MESRLDRISDWNEIATSAGYSATRLATKLQMSDRQVRRYFAERYGCTPHAFLNSLRLQVAHAALVEGASIKWAAAMGGYKQLSHFSRAFKKAYGRCPSCFSIRPTEEPESMSGMDNKCPVSITVLDSSTCASAHTFNSDHQP